jgi:hypothetical protein
VYQETLVHACGLPLHCILRRRIWFNLLLLQIVASWNGMAIGAFAWASRVLANQAPAPRRCFPDEAADPKTYLAAAVKVLLSWKARQSAQAHPTARPMHGRPPNGGQMR